MNYAVRDKSDEEDGIATSSMEDQHFTDKIISNQEDLRPRKLVNPFAVGTPINSDINAVIKESDDEDQQQFSINPLHQQWLRAKHPHLQTPQINTLNNDVNTLMRPTSTIKTSDLNLDHDIAGDFEAVIDQKHLRSSKQYDFMNFDVPLQITSQPQSHHQQQQ